MSKRTSEYTNTYTLPPESNFIEIHVECIHDTQPPMSTPGDLWNVYRQVQLLLEQDPVLSQESKLTLDTNGYETCFRLLNGGPFAERIAEKVDIPSTLVMQVEKILPTRTCSFLTDCAYSF